MMVIMILAIIINEDKRAWCPAGGSFPFLVAHPGVKYCFLRFSAQSIHFHDLSTIYPFSRSFPIHDLSTIYPFSRSIHNLSILRCASISCTSDCHRLTHSVIETGDWPFHKLNSFRTTPRIFYPVGMICLVTLVSLVIPISLVTRRMILQFA